MIIPMGANGWRIPTFFLDQSEWGFPLPNNIWVEKQHIKKITYKNVKDKTTYKTTYLKKQHIKQHIGEHSQSKWEVSLCQNEARHFSASFPAGFPVGWSNIYSCWTNSVNPWKPYSIVIYCHSRSTLGQLGRHTLQFCSFDILSVMVA